MTRIVAYTALCIQMCTAVKLLAASVHHGHISGQQTHTHWLKHSSIKQTQQETNNSCRRRTRATLHTRIVLQREVSAQCGKLAVDVISIVDLVRPTTIQYIAIDVPFSKSSSEENNLIFADTQTICRRKPPCKSSIRLSFRFYRTPTCDRRVRTDRQTQGHYLVPHQHSVAKNCRCTSQHHAAFFAAKNDCGLCNITNRSPV